MKSAIGRGMVATLLLAAGCGSDDNGMTGSGGHADAGSGGAGMGGISASGGMGGSGSSGHGGGTADSGAGGSAGVGAGGAGGAAGGTGGGAGTGEGGIGGKGSGGSVGIDAAVDGAGVRDGGTGGSDGGSDWLGLPPVPPALEVPAGATLKIHDRGIGVQIYTCTASGAVDAGTDGGSATYAWVLKAPDAKLFDSANVQVGTHGIGPNWTSTVDGSKVNGAKVAQVDSPVASAIPWLLLRASANSGTGAFADITYVQRVNTIGGKAPVSGCDATAVNTDMSIDYSADYYFYTGGAGAAWLALPANVPSLLAVPAGATLKLHDHAIGAQIYTCTASGGGVDGGVDGGVTSYAWVLKAPDAILYDASFTQVGTHGAGPQWLSNDGSLVNGTKLQQSSPLSTAIPWLLLKAASTSGNGVFTDIAYVQRLNTAGGVAPAAGCDSTTVNVDTRVNYSADYYFFTSGTTDGGTGG